MNKDAKKPTKLPTPTEVHALNLYTPRPYFSLVILCIASFLTSASMAENGPPKANKDVSTLSVDNDLKSAEPTIEVSATAIHRNFSNNDTFKDTLLGLAEARYLQNDFVIDLGIIYQNQDDKGVTLNQLAVSDYHKKFDYKIGKFVTKVGVLDYASSINSFNRTRTDYYDERNINIRSVPAWMAQINMHPSEDSTVSLIVQPYDKENSYYSQSATQFSVDSLIPFLLTNTNDDTLDYLGEQLFVPIYEKDGKPAVERYIDSKQPDIDNSFNNSTIGMNFATNKEDYSYGLFVLMGLSKNPLFTLDEEFVAAASNLDEEDRAIYVADYLAQIDNEPIKSIEYYRYNQIAGYYESTFGNFGLRGEVSFRDRFALLNKTAPQVSLGIGLDHQGAIYNNVEFQYFSFPTEDLSAYYAIWTLQFDPFRFANGNVQFKNTLSYAVVNDLDLAASLSRLTYTYEDYSLGLEYLANSRPEYSPDTASIVLKATF